MSTFLRFDVAKFTHIPIDDPALKFVLANLESDMKWNADDPLQKAMLDASELRFNLAHLNRGYKNTVHEEFMSEKSSTSKEKATKTKDGVRPVATLKIKEENKHARELKEKMAVLKSAKGDIHSFMFSLVLHFHFCCFCVASFVCFV